MEKYFIKQLAFKFLFTNVDSIVAFEVHVKDARCMTEVFEFPKNCFCCDWVNF